MNEFFLSELNCLEINKHYNYVISKARDEDKNSGKKFNMRGFIMAISNICISQFLSFAKRGFQWRRLYRRFRIYSCTKCS